MIWAKKPIWGTVAAAAMLATSLAACKSGTPKAGPTPPATQPAATQSATPPASPTPAAPPGSHPTALDPCVLVDQQAASALIGVAYGPGKLETDPGGAKRCVYGAQTHNVFEVILAQAASVDEAKAYAAALRAQAEAELHGKVAITQLSGVGDDAEQLSGAAQSINLAAIYVRKGAIGFALVDETNNQPPTIAALIAAAQTVVGELP